MREQSQLDLAPLPKKWRPKLWHVLIALNLAVLALPLAGLTFFRMYENQLVQETETELIAQAAIIAAQIKRAVKREAPDGVHHGKPVAHQPGIRLHEYLTPVPPVADLALAPVLPPRPDAQVTAAAPDALLSKHAIEVLDIFADAQRVTLSGLRLLDATGLVLGNGAEAGQSLAHVPEIAVALTGRYTAALRKRPRDEARPGFMTLSRATDVRVFSAFPVVSDKHLLAVVYLSRTPENILQRLWMARTRAALAISIVLASTLGLAFVASRTLLGPVHTLTRRADELAAGKTGAITPLAHAGTREFAELADSVSAMAMALDRRATYLSRFAGHVSHEFKTPLTSISGAAELLADNFDTMAPDERRRFLGNMIEDTDRLRRLIDRLQDLARAENVVHRSGITAIGFTILDLKHGAPPPGLEINVLIDAAIVVSMPEEVFMSIATNLALNAAQAGATMLLVTADTNDETVRIRFSDDGPGVSAGNRGRIFEPFFTTRRDSGGTGLGLGIVKALLEAYGGDIALADGTRGAAFDVTLPTA